MKPYPAMVPKKRIEELRSCKGCNLTVMAKGDWHGWKGIDVGGGQMHWFCDKTPCRQLRDETIARRSHELLLEQQQQQAKAAENTELIALRKRVADLEAATQRPGEGSLVAAAEDADPSSGPASDPVSTHIISAAGGSLCGLAGPTVKAIELSWDHSPCQACVAKWQAIAIGASRDASATVVTLTPTGSEDVVTVPSSDGQSTYKVTHSGAGWSCECEGYRHRGGCKHIDGVKAEKSAAAEVAAMTPSPVPVQAAAAALYGERPRPKPLAELPKFTPQLITAACDAPEEFVGKPILVPPGAYPELDMATLDPEKLRGGVTGLFRAAGLVVDRIEQARDGNRVAGIVFTLKHP